MAKNNMHLLAIDDEPHVMRFLQSNLQLANYTVLTASRGLEGLRLALETSPDLVLLDLGLPDMNGLEVLRQLRRESDVPVIIITARDDEESMVTGLSQGADDYLIKPFSGRALQARIEAVLRRYRATSPVLPEEGRHQFGSLYVDVPNRRVTLDSRPVSLTPIEFALLVELIRSKGRVRFHSDLLTTVWGPEYRDDVTVLRAAIYRLRHKVELDPSDPKLIRTEAGVGYSFCATNSACECPSFPPAEANRVRPQAQLIPQLTAAGDSRAR
jgi:two-component system KDP operon response regulator KdpE